MSETNAVSIRGVGRSSREAYSRLRGTYLLDGAEVFKLGLELLELELNICVGGPWDRVQKVRELIQHRRDQIVSRYQLAHALDEEVKGGRG
jgi:hypothetical protein